jgi:hypothetical protein
MCGMNFRPGVGWVAAFILTLLLLSPHALAQENEFSLSGGYAHLYGAHGGGLFHNQDGSYLDGDLAWHVPDPQFPLLLGVGVSGSGYFDRHDSGFGNDNSDDYYFGYGGDDHLYSDVGLFEIEPRIAVSLWSTLVPGLYLKPRLGAGLLVDSYSIDQAYSTGANTGYIDTRYHTGVAFELHPALQAGYAWGPGAAGGEISYMPAWGDFGRLGNKAQELRLGVFYTFRF